MTAQLPVRPSDLLHHHPTSPEPPGQARPAPSAFNAHPLQPAQPADPGHQLAIARWGRRKAQPPQPPPELVERDRHLHIEVGVTPTVPSTTASDSLAKRLPPVLGGDPMVTRDGGHDWDETSIELL